MMKKVAVIMGSDSDLPVVQGAISKLREFGVEVEAHVMSAHRTPEQAAAFSKNARENGFGVIIAAAGKAAITGRRTGCTHHPSGHRNPHQVLYSGWSGCPSGYCSDAFRHSGCHRCH